MIFGLAFYGDGVDDAATREIIDGVWRRVLCDPDAAATCRPSRSSGTCPTA